MKKNTMALLLSACMAVPAAAAAAAAGAEPGFYVGGGYTFATLDIDGASSNADVGALFARGGYQINEYIALEARLGDGVQDDTVDGVKLEIDNMYGGYVKVGRPSEVGLYPYALLGYTHVELKARVPGYSATSSDSDVSYGIGADYWFSRQLSAGLEYANFYDKDGVKVSGLTLGMNYKF